MSDVNASYETLLDFITFLGISIHYRRSLMYEIVFYLHQIFTDCMSNQYTHFDMLACQIYPQDTEISLV